jgi:hypothetical protein
VKPSTLTGSREHAVVDSPVGPLTLVAVDGVLAGLYMTEQRHLPPNEAFGEPAEDPDGAPFAAAAGQLQEYFAGARTAFDLELATYGTAFQRLVWAALQDIPYGQTVSYRALSPGGGRRWRADWLWRRDRAQAFPARARAAGQRADARVTPGGLTGPPPRSRTPGPGMCRIPRPAAAPR